MIMKKFIMGLSLIVVSMVSFGQNTEKDTSYIIKLNKKEYEDFLNSKNNVSPIMYVKIKNTTEKKGSFGVVGGIGTTLMDFGGYTNFSGGGWIQSNKVGFEYNFNGKVTTDFTADNYVKGYDGRWIAGGWASSYGFFIKEKDGVYYGGGVQTSTEVGLENVSVPTSINSIRVQSRDINIRKTLPYFTIGYLTNLGEYFVFKGGVILSKFTSVNFGVGYGF